jgi:predicted nucleic acid-binding protein
MKIYLDNCCLQRPLDDKSQLRVQLESEAVLAVLNLCEGGQVGIISSEVLEWELDRNPNAQRKAYVEEILAKAETFVEVDSQIEQRAKELEGFGLKAMDALHVASAEAEQADYFCSCDDRLLRRAKAMSSLKVSVVSPLELAEEIT